MSNTASAEGGGLWNGTGNMSIDSTMITLNTASGAEANQGGGGVFNAGGTVMINGAVITDNVCDGMAGSGGGILNDLGTLTVIDTEINGNSSIRAGGGIEENSTSGQILTMTNVTLNNNTTASSPGNGGGLHITGAGDSNISGGIVMSNIASAEGGGLWNGSGIMSIDGVFISENQAGLKGGGIFNTSGKIEILRSTIYSNQSTEALGQGGGCYNNAQSEMTIMVSTISGNTATQDGGGVFNAGNSFTLNACTIAFNEADNGGGIYAENEVQIMNTIVAENDGITAKNVSEFVVSGGFNLIGEDDEDNFEALSSDQIDEDPMLDEIMENDGNTPTHSLSNGSPAYNMGDPDANFEDQRGFPVFDGRRDIGAYESQENLVSSTELSSLDNLLSIYPNPTSNFLNYNFRGVASILKIKISNSSGQVVFSKNVENTLSGIIDLEAFNSDILLITFTTDKGNISRKFVKI